MIDFSKIPITQEKLDSFGGVQLKGQICSTSTRMIPKISVPTKEMLEEEIKLDLHEKIYGELINPFYKLRDVLDYLLNDMNYRNHPFDIKEIKENLEKIEKVLERPK